MRDIQEFFLYGLDREIPPLAVPPLRYKGLHRTDPANDVQLVRLNLAPGKKKQIPGIPLGLPEWDATKDRIPFPDSTVGEIHAYQFLEHLTGEDAVRLLRECQRVLAPGGVMNIVVPYYNSAHMAQALDHKSFWSEETWHWLFGNEYYDDHEFDWKLRVHCCFIMGIVERNLDLFTQLVKE